MLETVGCIVVAREAKAATHPQLPLLVAIETGYDITSQRRRVIGMRKIGGKAIAVELVQPVFCRYPDVAVFVLTDIIDKATGEAL